MKKNILGISSLTIALILCGYTKHYAWIEFKLLTDPTSANIVNDPAQWSSAGVYFGTCDVTTYQDLACEININTSTMGMYFHEDANENLALNTFNYASAQNPKQSFLEITEEASGTGSDRRIVSITAYKYTSGVGWTADPNVHTYDDITFKNARE